MEQDWATLNQTSLLDPAMRQLVTEEVAAATGVRYHEPQYLELYLSNQLELEQSHVMFAELVRHAILAKGGRIEEMPTQCGEEQRQEIRAMAAIHHREECAQLARATFATSIELEASHRRLEAQRATEADKRGAFRRKVIHTYGLQNVPMVVPAGQAEDPTATQLLADFIHEHGSEQHLQQFVLFQAANHSLGLLEQRWVAKAHLQTEEHPLHSADKQTWKDVRLLRGLLWVVGFEHGGEAIAEKEAEARQCVEEDGDICSQDVISTDTVAARLGEPACLQWLTQNAAEVHARFGCQLSPTVKQTIACLRSVLQKAIGLDVVSAGRKRSRKKEGKRSASTSWQIGMSRRDEMLELAYAVRPHYAAPTPGEWDVAATVERMQPAFRWQKLTGEERPAHWAATAPHEQPPSPPPQPQQQQARKRKTPAS